MGVYRGRIWVFIVLVCGAFLTSSAQDQYKYIVFFTDKEGTPYTLDEPEMFMSAEAIDRRNRFNIPIDESDLPLSADYLQQLSNYDYDLQGQSRWLNAVLVTGPSDEIESILLDEPYVRKVTWAALHVPGGRLEHPLEYGSILAPNYRDRLFWQAEKQTDYGFSANQVQMLNGQFLHNNGWTGSEMMIAVLDAGFINADELEAFAYLRNEDRIKGTWDFVDYDTGIYESSGHGTSVLSTMAGSLNGLYQGTAPDASYLLLKTEDIRSEQIVEEFNYVLGLEYAEQMGADVVNTSLGYTRYDHPEMDHENSELDGDHPIASIGGDIAASKGLIVINSAGNEGDSPWQHISMPSDGDSILAVGSVNAVRERSAFSGKGWPGSRNVKPNVMAQGEECAVINTAGEIVMANGTSFSAPILCGLTACLWQAFPERSNMEILRAIEQSSSQYLDPDNLNGFGIPDFQAAYALLYQEENQIDLQDEITIFPNPFSNNLTLTLAESPDQDMNIYLANDIGQVLFEQVVHSGSRKTVNLHFNGVNGLNMGLYFLKIKTSDDVLVFKLIKV